MRLMTPPMFASLFVLLDSIYNYSNVILCTTLHFSPRSNIFFLLIILLGKHVYLKSNSTLPCSRRRLRLRVTQTWWEHQRKLLTLTNKQFNNHHVRNFYLMTWTQTFVSNRQESELINVRKQISCMKESTAYRICDNGTINSTRSI